MIPQSILDETKVFLEHLGLSEEPFGVYYDDTKPENAFGPKPGPPISRELEEQGKVDMQEVFKSFFLRHGQRLAGQEKEARRLYFHG
jgi:hypothetical protein